MTLHSVFPFLQWFKFITKDTLKASVYEYISKNCFVAKVGNKHFFDTKNEAIKVIFKKLDEEACSTCTSNVFSECK